MDDKNTTTLEQAHIDFISTVSHELRTPLTSIRGFADTLLSSYERLTPQQRNKFLYIIKEQSNRLINLVENLLTASKLQSGKELLVYKMIDVVPFVDSCIQMIKNQYKTHKYEFHCEKNLPKIFVDTDKFQQVMLNLIDNASKYSKEGTTVYINVGQNFKENTLSISVKDEGIGIKPEDIEKIFNKFSRIDSPLTRSIQGNGLGLYITKSLVEKMNGIIKVNSSDKGSEFTVTFNIADPNEDTIKKMSQTSKEIK